MKQRFVSRTQKGVSRWQNSVSRKSVRENLVHADDYVGGKVPPGFGTMVYGPELGVSSFWGGASIQRPGSARCWGGRVRVALDRESEGERERASERER